MCNLLYSKGTLLISHDRMTGHVINRLRPPADGDILVPGGTVSVLGTTSVQTDNLETVRPTVEEIDRNIIEGTAMIPSLATARYIRAFSRVRPLLQSSEARMAVSATRGFALLDHTSQGLTNFCTITGGKLTTFRLMAEKTSDLVARGLAIARDAQPTASLTGAVRPADGPNRVLHPAYWYQANNSEDMILCECEMVPQSAIDEIVKCAPGAEEEMTLEAIALQVPCRQRPMPGIILRYSYCLLSV